MALPPLTRVSVDAPDPGHARPGRITARTLVTIRWIAIAGQLTAVTVTYFQLGYALPLLECLVCICGSIQLNLLASLSRASRRLGDGEACGYLAFDVGQLSLLLFLTGGTENPFAVMLLAPVAIGGTFLSRPRMVLLTGLAVALTVVLAAAQHFPVPWADVELELPDGYGFASAVAIAVTSLFIALYNRNVAQDARNLDAALRAAQMALDRERRGSALGALAAAAAHELGTPLATIVLAAKELVHDTPEDDPRREDLELILAQGTRCRDILQELGRNPDTDGGPQYETMPLPDLVDLCAEPHFLPTIAFEVEEDGEGAAPLIRRLPEILHGLGNYLQNAMQFARETVVATAGWDAETVWVRITDDGPGFPPNLLERMGEPYLSGRGERIGHLGLGVFIAQTLLETTGARVAYRNRKSGGAEIEVRWPRSAIATE